MSYIIRCNYVLSSYKCLLHSLFICHELIVIHWFYLTLTSNILYSKVGSYLYPRVDNKEITKIQWRIYFSKRRTIQFSKKEIRKKSLNQCCVIIISSTDVFIDWNCFPSSLQMKGVFFPSNWFHFCKVQYQYNFTILPFI